MTFGSLFAGVGGFDLGLERAGMRCAWQVEINPHCQHILARHWPNTTRESDVRSPIARYGRSHDRRAMLAPVDVICGGFPCQDVSVAGGRAGLDGERSGLWFCFRRILAVARPSWCIVENVPGLLSSNGGRDFATIVRGLVELGYGVAWRVLDAQYFGLAQRRKRVFIVGSLGDGRAASVLFEPESVRWDPPPSRAPRPGAAGAPVSRALGSVGGGDDPGAGKGNVIASTVRAAEGHHGRSSPRGDGRDNLISHTLNASPRGTGPNSGQGWNSTFVTPDLPDVAWALQERDGKGVDSDTKDGHLIVFDPTQITHPENRSRCESEQCHALASDAQPPHIAGTIRTNVRNNSNPTTEARGLVANTLRVGGRESAITAAEGKTWTHEGSTFRMRNVVQGVRRLTPRECERLQGFPDDWTSGQSDGRRYQQLGNAVPPPEAEWIGRRIVAEHGAGPQSRWGSGKRGQEKCPATSTLVLTRGDGNA